MVGVALIEDNMRENILRWFGYIYPKSTDAVVSRSDMVLVEGNTRGVDQKTIISSTIGFFIAQRIMNGIPSHFFISFSLSLSSAFTCFHTADIDI